MLTGIFMNKLQKRKDLQDQKIQILERLADKLHSEISCAPSLATQILGKKNFFPEKLKRNPKLSIFVFVECNLANFDVESTLHLYPQ